MENQQVPASKLKGLLLAFAVLVVLIGGGFAIWSVTRKEDEDEEPTVTQTNEGANLPEVGGRPNLTNFYTEEELMHSALVNNDLPDRTPEYQAVLVNSDEGKQLIEARMEKIQLNPYDADLLRHKHLVGKNLEHVQSLSRKANKAVIDMFGLVEGVKKGDHLTYPVYGKYETKGAALRADMDAFLAKDGQGFNVSQKRHGGKLWWFGSVGLNLMYGSKNAYVHSADHIWWGHIGDKGRDGLDFYKVVNGHDIDDKRLLEMKMPNGKKVHDVLQIPMSGVKGIFAAWGIIGFVKEWRDAMNYFDKVTRQEAITALEREGLIRKI